MKRDGHYLLQEQSSATGTQRLAGGQMAGRAREEDAEVGEGVLEWGGELEGVREQWWHLMGTEIVGK